MRLSFATHEVMTDDPTKLKIQKAGGSTLHGGFSCLPAACRVVHTVTDACACTGLPLATRGVRWLEMQGGGVGINGCDGVVGWGRAQPSQIHRTLSVSLCHELQVPFLARFPVMCVGLRASPFSVYRTRGCVSPGSGCPVQYRTLPSAGLCMFGWPRGGSC